ncbi:hypothetical protein [Eubacterium maltosivorans]|uniref:hypothetical protein n=1 Tax=Eubacterium maltosivorans TaxID=2041044 RepID=UPI00189E6C71|nr:hypothetical protein [Eubacterium maltosivorans]
MTKQRRINFQKVSSVLVILFGVVMVLAAFLEFGGFTIMRLAVSDVELGARQISELLATMGVFSLVLAVASIVAGIMGFRNAALGKEKLRRCGRIGFGILVVLVMYYAFLFVVDTLDASDFVVAALPVLYMISVVLNERGTIQEGDAEV